MSASPRPPTWFSRVPTEGLPALLCAGRADRWWCLGDRLVWWEGGRLWFEDRARVGCLLLGAVEVAGTEQDWVAVGEAGCLRFREGRVTVHPAAEGRRGRDLAVHRLGGRWACTPTLPLPEGAEEAAALWPFPTGRGLVWRFEGWLYRLRAGHKAAALGLVSRGSAIRVGPEGAVLLGDEACWHAAAAPGRPLQALPRLLMRHGWGVRFSPDGAAVAGLDAAGRGCRLDLCSEDWEDLGVGRLPLDAAGTVLSEASGTVFRGERVLRWGLREASWDLTAPLLHGPGAVSWDLSACRPLFTQPAYRLGATVATDGGVATVDWERGEGTWVDPQTGRPHHPFHLPLADDDMVERGWAEGEAACFLTMEGRVFRVRRGQVKASDIYPPPLRARRKTPLPAMTPPLPFESSLDLGSHRAAWNTDGLLAILP